MTDPKRESPSDEILVAALATGASQADAARTAGISQRTVHRRLADPEFAARVTQTRDEYVARVTYQLMGLLPTAVQTLAEMMGPDKPAGVRLRAASTAVTLHRMSRDATEIEDRLRFLEDQALRESGELS